jgi:hypothetical protein
MTRKLILVLALVLAIAGTFVFGVRVGRHARRMHWQNEPIHPWMSLPFIAHTHHVPVETLYEAIGVPYREHDRRPVRVIARAEKKPVADLLRELESAVANAHRAKAP